MTPAARSAATAARSESAVTDNEDGSTSSTRIAASPSPAIRTAFSPAECVSGERYTAYRSRTPSVRTAPPETRCSAATRAQSTELDAVSWMTPDPRNRSGSPSSLASQSITTVSTSVTAGEVAHSIPCTASPDDSRSPSTAGPDALAGKYA